MSDELIVVMYDIAGVVLTIYSGVLLGA